MAPPNPRADWERLGDRFYQKTRIYDGVFDEDLELENYVIAAAPYAGALGTALLSSSFKSNFLITCEALHRSESKVYRYRDAQTAKSSIDIYSFSGQLISRFNVCFLISNRHHQVLTHLQWEYGAIRGMGWSDNEELLVVSEDGVVHRYFGLHGDFAPFSLGNVCATFQ
jgi:vacuolar protein sorting-associated protein 16